MTSEKLLPLILSTLLLTGCWAQAIHHEPKDAIAAALKYGKVAFVDRNIDAAYDLTGPDKSRLTKDDLSAAIQRMHPDGAFPSAVEAYAWEKVPTQRMIHVYLEGRSTKGSIYYRLTANGDAESGYVISEAYTQPEKFKGSPLSEPIAHRKDPSVNAPPAQ